MWKQLTESFLLFLDGWGGGDVQWRPLWCVVDGTPHRLRSGVLAGRDNYTAVWNKKCVQRGRQLLRYIVYWAIWPGTQSSQRDKEQWQTFILQGNHTHTKKKSLKTTTCMFLSEWLHEECMKRESERIQHLTRLTYRFVWNASVSPNFLSLVVW